VVTVVQSAMHPRHDRSARRVGVHPPWHALLIKDVLFHPRSHESSWLAPRTMLIQIYIYIYIQKMVPNKFSVSGSFLDQLASSSWINLEAPLKFKQNSTKTNVIEP
jgi:hypothetical protein